MKCQWKKGKGKGRKAKAKAGSETPSLDPDEEIDSFTKFIANDEGATCRRKTLAEIYDCQNAGAGYSQPV